MSHGKYKPKEKYEREGKKKTPYTRTNKHKNGKNNTQSAEE